MRTYVRVVRRAPLPLGLLLPGRRVAARGARGGGGGARAHGARADRPRHGQRLDGVRAGGAAARAARDPRGRGHGPRPRRHGARGRPSPDAAGPRRARLVEPLPAAHARLGAHARDRRAPLARRPVGDARRPRGARARGSSASAAARAAGVRDEPTMRRLLAAFGRDALPGRAAAPVRAPRPRAQPRARRSSPSASACPAWRPATSTRTRPLRGARSRTRSSPCAQRTTLDASEPLRRGNHAHVLATPEAMAARFARPPGGGRRDRAARRARCASTSPRPRLPLPGRRGRRAPTATLAEVCRARLRASATPGTPARAEADRAARARSCALIASLGLSGFFLLHRDMLELAREVAVEVRGPDSRPRAAAAGPRPRLRASARSSAT